METITQNSRIVVVSAVAGSIFKEFVKHTKDFDTHMHYIASEKELQDLLNSNKVISYMSHPSAIVYLTMLSKNVEVSKEREYSYQPGDKLLMMGLTSRPAKGEDREAVRFDDYVFFLVDVKA